MLVILICLLLKYNICYSYDDLPWTDPIDCMGNPAFELQAKDLNCHIKYNLNPGETLGVEKLQEKCDEYCGSTRIAMPIGTGNVVLSYEDAKQLCDVRLDSDAAEEIDLSICKKDSVMEMLQYLYRLPEQYTNIQDNPFNRLLKGYNLVADDIRTINEQFADELDEFAVKAKAYDHPKFTEGMKNIKKKMQDAINDVDSLKEIQSAAEDIEKIAPILLENIKNTTATIETQLTHCNTIINQPKLKHMCAVNTDDACDRKFLSCCCFGYGLLFDRIERPQCLLNDGSTRRLNEQIATQTSTEITKINIRKLNQDISNPSSNEHNYTLCYTRDPSKDIVSQHFTEPLLAKMCKDYCGESFLTLRMGAHNYGLTHEYKSGPDGICPNQQDDQDKRENCTKLGSSIKKLFSLVWDEYKTAGTNTFISILEEEKKTQSAIKKISLEKANQFKHVTMQAVTESKNYLIIEMGKLKKELIEEVSIASNELKENMLTLGNADKLQNIKDELKDNVDFLKENIQLCKDMVIAKENKDFCAINDMAGGTNKEFVGCCCISSGLVTQPLTSKDACELMGDSDLANFISPDDSKTNLSPDDSKKNLSPDRKKKSNNVTQLKINHFPFIVITMLSIFTFL